MKVSTRDFSWGKGGRCVWLTTYHPCSAEMSRKSEALTYPEPLGSPRPVAGDLYFYFNLSCVKLVMYLTFYTLTTYEIDSKHTELHLYLQENSMCQVRMFYSSLSVNTS